MATRVSTSSNYARVLSSLRTNQYSMIRAQEQIASGRRILRPSDDPAGTSRVLSIERQLAAVGRYRESANSGSRVLDAASGALQEVSNLISESRSIMLQGMNGTLSQKDREGLASEVRLIREQLLDIANSTQGDRFLFGGTITDREPFESTSINGRERFVYHGDENEQRVAVAKGSNVSINVVGSDIFDRQEPEGASLVGSTGLVLGSTGNQGQGYVDLVLRHDSTDLGGIAASGIALVGGGADDTLLGTHSMVVDAVAGTIQLGDGTVYRMPEPGSPEESNFPVANGSGGTVRLDLTGWTGGDVTADVVGSGSISMSGGAFQAFDPTDANFAVRDSENETTIFLDATGLQIAGTEMASFDGAASIFDVLAGFEADLLNGESLSSSDIFDRMSKRLGELDRNHDNILVGMGVLGARSNRLSFADERASSLGLQLENLLSLNRDADLAEVALDLALAETTLQTTQAAGARLIQNTLLDFLR